MSSVAKWYVVRVVGGQESKVRERIKNEIKRLGLSDFVQQLIVPSEKIVQINNGKKVYKEKIFFPGYVIVHANLSGEIPHAIKDVSGVVGFLGETKGGDPVPVREIEINRMLGRIDKSIEQMENISIPYEVGEAVKVIDGPFNGFDGIIENIDQGKRKVEVMVKIFGRKTPLELSYMQVDKVVS